MRRTHRGSLRLAGKSERQLAEPVPRSSLITHSETAGVTACWTSNETRLVFSDWGLDDLDDLLQAEREFDGGALWPEQANQERIRDTRGQEKNHVFRLDRYK